MQTDGNPYSHITYVHCTGMLLKISTNGYSVVSRETIVAYSFFFLTS
jgi:hypothetical protein